MLSGRDRTITLTFAEDNSNYTATLSFATTDFSTDADSSGTITVTLQEDPAVTDTYTVKAGSGAATVTVYKVPVPTLTIASTSLTQSVNEGQTASIVVQASENPRRDLTIDYVPRESGSNYLVAIVDNGVTKGSGDTRSAEMEFAQAGPNPQPSDPWLATITIGTQESTNLGGIIAVDIVAGTGYTVGSPHTATVTVNDTSIPELSIANAEETLAGSNANFVCNFRYSICWGFSSRIYSCKKRRQLLK